MRLVYFVLLSLVLHVMLAAAIVYRFGKMHYSSSPSEGLHSGLEAVDIKSTFYIDDGISNKKSVGKKPLRGQQLDSVPSATRRHRNVGSAVEPDSRASVLSIIRQRIEQHRTYPFSARRRGIEGDVEVEFRITQGGSVEYVRVVDSSGFGVLDKAGLDSVKRAEPFPYYKNPLRVTLRFRLD